MHGRYALVIITGKLQRGSRRSRGAPRAYQLPEGATSLHISQGLPPALRRGADPCRVAAAAEHPLLSNTVGDACQARARLALRVVHVEPVRVLRIVGQPVLLG